MIVFAGDVVFRECTQLTFERLGALRCRFAEPASRLLPSRWPRRPALHKYHGS
ncbi:MAG: hypothetical protein MUF08_11105 [Burkholderiaceae bacterium]|jgi:hypothetical protein|nr:hypothetical protein [Burkholderiaceae bacterium]MCU0965575.1 hypothetical protein [Burkholderiaceae bacterium]